MLGPETKDRDISTPSFHFNPFFYRLLIRSLLRLLLVKHFLCSNQRNKHHKTSIARILQNKFYLQETIQSAHQNCLKRIGIFSWHSKNFSCSIFQSSRTSVVRCYFNSFSCSDSVILVEIDELLIDEMISSIHISFFFYRI